MPVPLLVLLLACESSLFCVIKELILELIIILHVFKSLQIWAQAQICL